MLIRRPLVSKNDDTLINTMSFQVVLFSERLHYQLLKIL